MKTTTKMTLLMIVFVIALSVAIMWTVNNMTTAIGKEMAKVSDLVGKKMLFDKDTVMIVDYSLIKSTYTLSNGREVGQYLAKKMLIAGQ